MSHLSGCFISFAFEQNNSCLPNFFVQKITSKPGKLKLIKRRRGCGVHPSVPNCVLKSKHSKLVNFSNFFSVNELTALKISVAMRIRFKIASNILFLPKVVYRTYTISGLCPECYLENL